MIRQMSSLLVVLASVACAAKSQTAVTPSVPDDVSQGAASVTDGASNVAGAALDAASMGQSAAAEALAAFSGAVTSTTAYEEVDWAPMNPEVPDGPQLAVVQGNPEATEFMMLAKVPAGFNTGLHSHPTMFTGSLIKGTMHVGRSSEDYEVLEAGGVWQEPREAVHYVGCSDEGECMIAGYMAGPMQTTPADSPQEGPTLTRVISADEMSWTPVNPEDPSGPQQMTLQGDWTSSPFVAMVWVPAGREGVLQTHTHDYSAALVSGTMERAGLTLEAGSHWTQTGGEPYLVSCVSETPCMFMGWMDGAFDVQLVEPLVQ